ncbi:MAG: LysM peptidoglycan-binding domain-containing protein [Proteobacteria bacterium]|nr:LysM peptidoglycan-binding domain-containing protein [Pseudomonadota bacterium]
MLVVAIAVAAASHASAVSAASCTQFHIAKPNDSWTRLAARFKIPLPELLALNNATTRTALFIGDRVCVSIQPAVATPSSTEQFTRKQSKAIIREVWPDELEETALFVAQRESNLVHSVVGGRGDCCIGLFQIYWSLHRSWLAASGIMTAEQLLDPRANAEAALALYRRNGNSWRPWWTSSWRP